MERILKVTIKSPKNYDDTIPFSEHVAESLQELADHIIEKEQLAHKEGIDGIDEKGNLITENGLVITWIHSYKNLMEK